MGSQVELSDIQRFYKDTNVFLTGATGFIGKIFLEKILRALPVKKVFILVRSKNDEPARKRLQDLFESVIFDGLKRSKPEVFEKVTLMEGDCSLPMLGLSKENIGIILNEVNVIFHCAATAKYDEHLKNATRTNVRAVKDLVDIAKMIENLKTFVYVGTAFSNSNNSEIKEEVYPAKIKAEDLIAACESLDDATVSSMTKSLTGDWPNLYTFTKQVAEDYINREGKSIPVCITRPTIVASTSAEPVSAFTDNTYGLAGFGVPHYLGICHITYSKNEILDIVPADFVVNECIAAGWNTGVTFQKQRSEIPVYNISSGQDNPLKPDLAYQLFDNYGLEYPSAKLVAYPIHFITSCRYNYLVLRFIFHTVVAFLIDQIVLLQGGKPKFSADMKRLHGFQEAYEHLTTKYLFIHVENTHKILRKMSYMDRELFNFDIGALCWESYFQQLVKGLRVYLLKDPLETVAEGRKRMAYLRKVMTIGLIIATVVLYAAGKIVLFRLLPLIIGGFAYVLSGLVC